MLGMEDLNFTSDLRQKQHVGKRKNTDIDLNKRPQQRRLGVKKHRPRILDANKPKKIFKEKLLKEKVPRLEKTTGLDSNTIDATTPKKVPKEKVRKNACKSSLGFEPRTPNPFTLEPLAPITTVCMQTTPESFKLDPTIGRFSNHGTGSCRRSLNFNLENPIEDGSDGNVIQVKTTSGDELRYGDVDIEEEDGKEHDSTLVKSRIDERGGNRTSRQISIFNMLTLRLGLESEDFGFSYGMRKLIQAYRNKNLYSRWDDKTLVAVLKDFPNDLKKRRTGRKKRSFYLNLGKTFKLFNGQKVPTKKRSNRKRGSSCWGLVLPALAAVPVKRSELNKRKQNAEAKFNEVLPESKQNPTFKVNLVPSRLILNPPEVHSTSLLNLSEASSTSIVPDGHNASSPGPPNYKDTDLLMMLEPLYEKYLREFDGLYNGIDCIEQKLGCNQIGDNFKQDPQQNTPNKLVPYIVNIKTSKIHKPIPKVDLDEETVSVWNRLMGNDTDQASKEHIEDKEKWWRKERKVFRERVDSLIARMHLIQGNRKFSPWKGSVVDSVVGVFLTQNVSDNLSSSAFMALASRFPVASHVYQFNGNDCSREIALGQKSIASQTSSTDEVLSSGEKERTVVEKSAIEEVSSFGCSISDRHLDCSFKDNSASTNSFNFNSSNGGEEKREKVKINETNIKLDSATKSTKKKAKIKEKKEINWDEMRRIYSQNESRPFDKMDSVDWNAVRCATEEEVANIIAERGMNNILARRIKVFLDHVVKHNMDLEWLRNAPDNLVKEYLSSIDGLGLKSVECVRLLALQHHAFPVDTNVGRIVVRLGWVPLQPLPDDLEIDLLDQYPLVDSIQKYLWPRLCMLDQQKLYELHYQLITFGKVFCTKRRPNCNACPLKAECRHFASAYARAKLRLPAPREKSIVAVENPCTIRNDIRYRTTFPLISLVNNLSSRSNCGSKSCDPIVEFPQSPEQECTEPLVSNLGFQSCEPIVELPQSPEQECSKPLESNHGSEICDPVVGVPLSREQERVQRLGRDIEDLCNDSDDDIPTIMLDTEELKATILKLFEKAEFDTSKALIPITPETSIHNPKLKIVSRLRTVHNVYELEDGHPLLETFDKREIDDPCPYLLAIWVSGNSTNAVREKNTDEVGGTILIPCRTATRGRFPLNGTYFQVNEVFADDESSECPIRVSRKELWHLKRRALYCGTSATSIFKGMDTLEIQYCFWKGFVCVKGFNRRTRATKPLMERFHLPGGPAKKSKEEYEYDE